MSVEMDPQQPILTIRTLKKLTVRSEIEWRIIFLTDEYELLEKIAVGRHRIHQNEILN
jgi:hypothetical protein